MTRRNISRVWFAVAGLVALVAMVIQLILVIRGVDVLVDDEGNSPGVVERVVRFFSYFTIQSNIVAMVTAFTLAAEPQRDGRWWRVARVAALVGMTVTIIVYHNLLAPIVNLDGVAKLTDIAFHYIAPLMTIFGWLLFGPWPRIDLRSLLTHLAWPVAYLLWVLVYGVATDWYPYPFVDVNKHGYPHTLLNALGVTVLLLAVGAAYFWIDPRRAAWDQRRSAATATRS